jgi:hypothetical protein
VPFFGPQLEINRQQQRALFDGPVFALASLQLRKVFLVPTGNSSLPLLEGIPSWIEYGDRPCAGLHEEDRYVLIPVCFTPPFRDPVSSNPETSPLCDDSCSS